MVILEKMARLYKRDQTLQQQQFSTNSEKISLAGSVESKNDSSTDYSDSESEENIQNSPISDTRYSIASAVVKPNGILKLRLKLLN
jgi:hypothetical protein